MESIIAEVAARHGISKDEAMREMVIVIDDAWDNPDPTIRERQRALFPKGKPSVEEFLRVMVKQIER